MKRQQQQKQEDNTASRRDRRDQLKSILRDVCVVGWSFCVDPMACCTVYVKKKSPQRDETGETVL